MNAKKEYTGDRFISLRTCAERTNKITLIDELTEAEHNLSLYKEECTSESEKGYRLLLQSQLLDVKDQYTIHQLNGSSHMYKGYPYKQQFSLLHSYKQGNKENGSCKLPVCCGLGEETTETLGLIKEDRKIPRVPFKVLDAPALRDDFYLNVVGWSSQGVLAVGLGSCVYLWSTQGRVTKLTDVGTGDSVISVEWSLGGDSLAIGTYTGVVQIWDVDRLKQLRNLKAHEGRVGALAWNSSVLSTGSKDKLIIMNDVKVKNHAIAYLEGHKQEICGLKWSHDEQQLASGGNDNKLFVWNNKNYERPSGRFNDHTAAVKALAWSPYQHGLLLSGGGTADRCIRSWNTLTNTMIQCTDTGSQVCNLMFSKTVNELVSTHGYSDNYVFVWKYEGMRKLATLAGHTSRVLYLAGSNDGETIVTGAGDETLRFWKVFPCNRTRVTSSALLTLSGKDLR
jgi:cell division cycle 20-like protein 1 (cofactor of APC complex)